MAPNKILTFLGALFSLRPRASLIVLTTLITYILWYRLSSVRKPRIHCGRGRLRTFLLERCAILTENYWPTWWAVNCHVNTIFRAAFQRPYKETKYERHVITLPDGGILPLDFGVDVVLPPDSPVLIILPGLTGDCHVNYITHFLKDAYVSGYRPVVFNQRGSGGVDITTPRLYSATNTEDVEYVIEYIHSLYPRAGIVAIGVSLGGIILSHYASKSGGRCGLMGAVAVSTPMHPQSSQHSLEKKWFNKKMYIDFLVNKLLEIVNRNKHILERNPSFKSKRIHRINSLTQFDDAVTAPMFGYETVEAYYNDSSLIDKLSNIQIPFIAIVAEDDPFIPYSNYPVDEFDSNSNTLLVSTKHGGHFGFLEGVFDPRGRTWLNRINQQVLVALKQY